MMQSNFVKLLLSVTLPSSAPMNRTVSKVFRRTIYLLLLLLAILVILGTIFFSQLDLDNYRYELERELSLALEQPVEIGRSKLTFNNGIALRFHNVTIGPQDARLADIPYLTATIKIAPLLNGQVILDQVQIDDPKLQVWLPMQNRPERGTTHQLTDQLGIRILTIRNAELKIHQRSAPAGRDPVTLSSLEIELHGWQPNKTARMVILGELQQAEKNAQFLLDGNLPSSPDPEVWRKEEFNYQLSIDNLALNLRGAAQQKKFPAQVNLRATLSGTPANGVQFDARLSDPTAAELFTLSGLWQSAVDKEAITKLNGDLLGLPLNGECYLLRQKEQQILAGRFGATDISLTPKLLEKWHIPDAEKLLEGSLERLSLVVEKTWPADQPLSGLPKISAEFTLTDLSWASTTLRKIEDFSAVVALEEELLTISDGLLVSKRQPVFFSGQIKNLYNRPQLALKIDARTRLESLIEPTRLPSGWTLSGALPAQLSLTGPLTQPTFLLQADLNKTDIALGPVLQKSPGQASTLRLEGIIEATHFQLDRLELHLPNLTITGNGCFDHDPNSNFFLLDIDPIELNQLQPWSPLLKQMRVHGTLHPTLERGVNGLQGRLQLVDFAAHLDNIVGDLQNTTGQINIDPQGATFENLRADLGQSSFVLNGQVDNWKTPQLDLTLQSSHVRAQDLIFPNQKLQLYDLDGGLQIDANGIKFNAIKVRLEQETEAVVNGSLANFKDPQVSLDITAEKGNIDHVIQLFIGPHKRPPSKSSAEHKPLLITAHAKQGTIGELNFKNAEGVIKDHRGVLTIYPLDFLSGEGSCSARVEFDRTQQQGLLKVSGHAENINATILHQELFKERGLINGSLRGDFYLEGTLAGNGFWHNALGGIHIRVQKGTLRKFRGLARVFSLLNVSQLLTGKLPDMDNEGMPFTLLEGSIKIAAGRAQTENLRITSEAMNMSLIGGQSLTEDDIDYNLGVMPLRTVDKVITAIPLAGWLLAGEDKALLTAHFKVEGSSEAPKVTAVPISTLSDTVFGIVKRTLGLPSKVVKDVGTLFKKNPQKKEEPTE